MTTENLIKAHSSPGIQQTRRDDYFPEISVPHFKWLHYFRGTATWTFSPRWKIP